MATPRTQTRPSPTLSPFAKPTGTMRVRRVLVRQDEVFTGKRYELETDQASPNNVIHLNPRLDKKAYEQAVALCPKIADLTWNDQTKRSVVLVNYWTVNYKTEMRATGKVGIRGLFVATSIAETDKSTAETPPIIPDTAAATETMIAYEAAQKAKAAETIDRENLDEWFPRDEKGKPVDQDDKEAIEALNASLTPLVDDDELTTPTQHKVSDGYALTEWTGATLTGIAAEKAIFHHFKRELLIIDPTVDVSAELLKALGGSPLGTCVEEMGSPALCTSLQIYLDNLNQKHQSENAPEDIQNNGAAIGVPEMTNEPQSAQNPAEKVVSNSQLPEAPFSANFKLTHKSGVEIQFTIRAASGAEGMPQIDKAISYLLENGYTTRQQAAQSLPPNATPIGSAPSAQSNDSGTAVCMMIKLARSFTGNKPQLEFEVDGFDNPIRYTSDNPGKLAAALKGIRKPDGSEFTAADMTDGRKFVGNWLLKWEKKQKDDGKTYTNFVSIAAA